jgi:Glycosyl hydrolases family 18
MIRHVSLGWNTKSQASRCGSRGRRGLRPWALEGLEDRVLLSGSPTNYKVNSIGNSPVGSGTTGDLPYVINLANTNPNPDGSLIQFDPTVFATPQTITVNHTLVLSEVDGQETIEGPGANLLTISGGHAVEVVQLGSKATAALSGLTITDGSNTHNKDVRHRIGTKLPRVVSLSLARPALRTEVRRLSTRKSPRPDVKTEGAPAAPALVSWPSRVYAPYVDTTLYPTPELSGAMSAGGIKYFTLGFIVADPGNHKPSWGGYSTDDINGGGFDMAMRAQVSAVRQQGGDVMISFGGATGKELAQVITNVKKLENAYQTVINAYTLTQIDFDIEGAAEANHASIDRRFKAVAALEQQAAAAGRTLNVWLTLPALLTGLDSEGMFVMEAAMKYGVKIAGVNIMTMDYGNSAAPDPGAMGQ